MRRTLRAVLVVSAIPLLASTAANAQHAIRQDCLASIAPVERLTYAHDKHRLWYQRFWNGKCQGLSTSFLGDACSENEPGWNVAVSDIMRQGTPQKAADLLSRACKLGELIGYEWAKDNNVRCIHTMGANSLSSLYAVLKQQGDIFDRLARMETKAKSMCQSLRPPPPRR
jgi:hypothetical protein